MLQMSPKILRRIGVALLSIVLSGAVSYGINHYFQERYRRITIARDTTFYLAPPFPDGYIDFLSALNALFSEGVTPASNAAIPLYLATSPKDNYIGWRLDAARAGMGVKDLPDPNTAYIDFLSFMSQIKPPSTDPGSQVFHEGQKELSEIWSDEIEARSRSPWTRDQDPDTYAWLQRNAAALQLIISASQKDRFFCPIVGRPDVGSIMHSTIPSLGVIHAFANLLAVHAMFSVATHDFAAWRADILAQQRLGRLLLHAPTLIQAMVGIAIVSRSNDIVTVSLASLTSEQARTILADLRSLPTPPDIADTLNEGERVSIIAEISLMARFGPTVESIDFNDPSVTLPAPASLGFQPPIHFDDLLRQHNQLFDRIVAAYRLPTYSQRRAEFKTIANDCKAVTIKTASGTTTAAIQMLIFGMPASFHRASELQDRLHQQSRMTQLCLLLTAYRRDHGAYPPQLAALPDLQDTANDLFADDRSLHYIPDSATIYSVGLNQRDDGGIFELPKEKFSAEMLLAPPTDDRPDFPDDIAIHLPQ
jgi:hypothetical protein